MPQWPQGISHASGVKEGLRFPPARLFTVSYFPVEPSRSRALRYWRPSFEMVPRTLTRFDTHSRWPPYNLDVLIEK